MRFDEGRHIARRITLIASAVLTTMAHASPLPPPPVSPAPVTDYEYDAKGNRTKVIQAKESPGFGFTTKNTYDPLDRLKTNTDPKNGVTTLGYNGQDRLTQVTDPRSLVTTYQLNGLGDMSQLSSPDTGVANSTHDENGNLKTRTDSRGVLATYTYDPLNRLKSVVYSKAGQTSQTYTWTYDETGGDFGYGVGRLTSSTFPGGNTKYGYDADGRQTVNIQKVGNVTLTTRYAYDIAGNVKSITYPSGKVLTIDYVSGKPSAMSWAMSAGSAPQPLISQIQWEPFGGVRSWLMHVGSGTKAQERVYDVYGRLVRYPLGDVVRDLTYDAADRIVSYTHLDGFTGATTAITQAMNQSFGYDEMGRLSQIMLPQTSWTIGYDANGNRTSVTQGGVTQTYTTSPTSNRLNEISNPARTFQYDQAGNTLVDTSGYTSTYGLDNRMATITKAGVTTGYVYNAEGQRLRKAVGTALKLFAYDPSGQIIGEYGSNGASQKEYIWLGNTPIAVHQPSTTETGYLYYVYADHLNAPRILIGSTSGAMRWRWLSEPFGSLLPEDAPTGGGAVSLNLRFPGQYSDQESGLNYNYFRDYDSTLGRYVQSDPIGLDGGMNTYAYVGGAPLRAVDPKGLDYWVEGSVSTEGGHPFHRSVCVGKYAGGRLCISFGVAEPDCYMGCRGEVYHDDSAAGPLVRNRFRSTSSLQDLEIETFFRAQIGTPGTYYLVGNSCRDYSEAIFQNLERRYFPSRTPFIPGGPLPWR